VLIIADNLTAATPSVGNAMTARDANAIRNFATRLHVAGADMLDLNLGFRSKGGPETAAWMVRETHDATGLPLCLDTADPESMRAGLAAARDMAGPSGPATPWINSFSLEQKKIERILPLAAEYGAPIVGYCVRDVVPQAPEERLHVAVELVELADAAGVPRDRLYLDPILFPLATFQDDFQNVLSFFDSLPKLFDPPVRTMVGLSNVGHGLPAGKRQTVEAVVLPMLAALGLDAVLLNVLSPQLRDALAVLRGVEGRSVFSGADLLDR